MEKKQSLVSIVIPLWNEERVIPELVSRLRELKGPDGIAYEFIIVNDGSTDRTEGELNRLLPTLTRWKVIKLSRNFGQQSAYRAGLDHVVFMDGDLQDPPELIPELVKKWQEGAKVVIPCRRTREEGGLRRFLFDLFHRLFYLLTGGVMPINSGTFGLMDRLPAEQLLKMPEVNLVLPALRSWVGFTQVQVYYDRLERAAGKPKQSFFRLLNYAWDGITSFSEVPLRLITVLGFVMFIIGSVYSVVLITIKLAQVWGLFSSLKVLGFTTLAVAVITMGGIQLMCLGVVGEYMARIFRESKRRPLYVIEDVTESKEAL